jgi:hypothetical protein
LGLLDEDPHDDSPAACRRNVHGARNSIPPDHPQLPELAFEMPHTVTWQTPEADLLDDFGEPQEPRLHVIRQRLDLGVDDGVEGLKGPAHDVYIAKKR